MASAVVCNSVYTEHSVCRAAPTAKLGRTIAGLDAEVMTSSGALISKRGKEVGADLVCNGGLGGRSLDDSCPPSWEQKYGLSGQLLLFIAKLLQLAHKECRLAIQVSSCLPVVTAFGLCPSC